MSMTAQQQRDVESVMSIVHSVISKTSLPREVDREDIVQYVMIEVCQARLRYDPARGASFRTFASHRIKGAVIDYIRINAPHRHVPLDDAVEQAAPETMSPLEFAEEFAERKAQFEKREAEKAQARRERARNAIPGFSPRRFETLTYLCEGLNNEQIAKKMGIAVKTVEKHRHALYRHVGTSNIVLLVRWAIREGHITA